MEAIRTHIFLDHTLSLFDLQRSQCVRRFHTEKTSLEKNTHYVWAKMFNIPQLSTKDKKTVKSTDGQTVIAQPRSLGKKLGQRKRKVNERTQTFKKYKNCLNKGINVTSVRTPYLVVEVSI